MNKAEDTEHGTSKGDKHSDIPGKVWSVYLSEAERQDKTLAENWKGDAEGILIFTGLFAATVAAFIIEGYKRLSPDSGAATVLLLNQISQQLSALSNNTQISPPPPLYSDSSFHPAQSAIRVNILWFLSLTLSLICALAATLMQQWSRRYRQLAQAETTLYKRARTRAYLFQGVQAFDLFRAVEAVPAMLHVAVFLFFAGLIEFLFSIDSTVGRVILGVLCSFGGIYIFLTFLPNARPNCPYRTPFSRDWLKWILVISTAPALLAIQCLLYSVPSDKFGSVRKRFLRFLRSLRWTLSDAMESLQEEIDKRALRWVVATVDDDDNIETLIEGIPEFLKAGTSQNTHPIVEELLDLQQPKPLGQHINRLIQTCTTDGYHGANEKLRRRRALICMDTVRSLMAVHSTFSYEMFGDKTWHFISLLEQDEDPVIAINAISTGALAACAYLRLVFKSGGRAPIKGPTLIKNLHQLVNAPWNKADLGSFPGCHLLILQGFISSLLPHLNSNQVTPTSFHVVWDTLLQIQSMTPLGHSNSQSKELFLELWAQLEDLPKTEHMDNVDEVLPIVRLMSMLRPTIERMQVQQAQYKRFKKAGINVVRTMRFLGPPSS